MTRKQTYLTEKREFLEALLYGNTQYVIAHVQDKDNEIKRLKACLMLAKEVGEDWRNDWSDFDGRTLRDQMNELDRVADGTMTVDEYRQSNLQSNENYE